MSEHDIVLDSSPGLVGILRAALERLEADPSHGLDNPAVLQFKQRILRSIAQFELSRKSLKAPDVIFPEAASAASAPSAENSTQSADDAADSAPDSVIVLVASRRKSGGRSAA